MHMSSQPEQLLESICRGASAVVQTCVGPAADVVEHLIDDALRNSTLFPCPAEVKVDVKEGNTMSEVDFAKIGVEEALKILQVRLLRSPATCADSNWGAQHSFPSPVTDSI
jgi:hypothetical protein